MRASCHLPTSCSAEGRRQVSDAFDFFKSVTTGLDPVVHATGASPWIAGSKSGNDSLQAWWDETKNVGWVERSETHRDCAEPPMVDFAPLNPPYFARMRPLLFSVHSTAVRPGVTALPAHDMDAG